MAVLNKIRQRSLFLIIVIAMALFSFVLADLFKNMGGFSMASQDAVAKVNGEQIKRDYFMNRVENMQRQFGNSRTNIQVMNLVWDQELRKSILEGQFDELGIDVERDQMRDLLKNALTIYPEFNNAAGLFDEDKLNEFIANLRDNPTQPTQLGDMLVDYASWNNIEQNVASGGREQTYFNMVRAGMIGTLAEGKMEYNLENNKVDIRYVQIPFTSIADSTITVDKNDISSYINANKEEYEVEASRDIYYVEFKEEATLEDEENIKSHLLELLESTPDNVTTTQVDETELGFRDTTDNEEFLASNSALKLYNDYIFKKDLPIAVADSIINLGNGGIYGPYKDGNLIKISKVIDVKQLADSVKVRHILIPFVGGVRADASVVKSDEEAKATADSIHNVIRSRRANFTDLLSLSSDLVSNENDGELEFAYTASMAPEFKEFSFNNRVGSLEVVRTDFGYHIIEVLEQGEQQIAMIVGNLAQAIEPSEETIYNLFNETQKFEIAVEDNDFKEVGEEKGYSVKPVSNVKLLDENIPGLGAQRNIVRWFFEEGTNVGNFRRFDLLGGGYAVAILTGINDEGVMSSEKASVSALPEIRKEKKAALIKARITGTTLDEIASAEGQTVKSSLAINMKNPTLSGAGIEPLVIGTAFGLTEGQISEVIVGENGIYIVEVTNVTPATDIENYQANANQIRTARTNTVDVNLYNALKETSKIDDYRSIFY